MADLLADHPIEDESPDASPLRVHGARDQGVANSTLATIAPLALPADNRIGHDTLRLTQVFCDERLASSLAVHGLAMRGLAFNAADLIDAMDPAVIEITLGTARAQVWIAIDLMRYPGLSAAVLPRHDVQGAQVSRTQEALSHAVAGLLLEPALTLLATLGFDEPRVISIRRMRLIDVNRGPFVHLSLDTHDLALALSPAAIKQMETLVARLPGVPVSDRFATVPIPGHAVVGVKTLAVDTLRTLAAGDVLLRALFPGFAAHSLSSSHPITESPRRFAPRAVATWGSPGLARLSAAVEFDGRSLVIVKEPHMSEELDSAYADAGLATDHPDDPIRIGELELPVQFEIDTVAMPLSQLSSLAPGYVVEFPVPFADARLRLVAHGRTIGYGELVTVGDHLGVRIIRMAHDQGARPRTPNGSVQ